MWLAEGDGQGGAEDVCIWVSPFGLLVCGLEQFDVPCRIDGTVAPLNEQVRFVPDLNVPDSPPVVLHKAIHKRAIVIQVVWWAPWHRVVLPRPVWRTIQASYDLETIALAEIDDRVVLGPAKLAWLRLDLGPNELLLGPPDPSLVGHAHRLFSLPRLYLSFEEKVGSIGVQIRVRYLPPGVYGQTILGRADCRVQHIAQQSQQDHQDAQEEQRTAVHGLA